MTAETVEQILKVIQYAKAQYSASRGIDDAYQSAVSRVAGEYHVTYQTIGDGCRRRLGLNNVGEFKQMLEELLRGHGHRLRALLKQRAPTTYNKRIDDFFSSLASGKLEQTREHEPPEVNFQVRLRGEDASVLRALAHLLLKSPEEILAEASASAIREQMKRFASTL